MFFSEPHWSRSQLQYYVSRLDENKIKVIILTASNLKETWNLIREISTEQAKDPVEWRAGWYPKKDSRWLYGRDKLRIESHKISFSLEDQHSHIES